MQLLGRPPHNSVLHAAPALFGLDLKSQPGVCSMSTVTLKDLKKENEIEIAERQVVDNQYKLVFTLLPLDTPCQWGTICN